jgi:hypothetical protein
LIAICALHRRHYGPAHKIPDSPPDFDQDLGFGQADEDLVVEKLTAQLAVEALAVAVSSSLSRLT